MSRKLALIIGNSEYQDQQLAQLVAPSEDVADLAEVLGKPEIGGFDDVITLANQAFADVHLAIADFFADKKRDDLLLLYFSGHGLLDDQGRLYLGVRNTKRNRLSGTAISANFITSEMDSSRSRRQVLILDCCHSGAFARGTKGAIGAKAITRTTFEGVGYGRVVFTATDATQYAWEGDQLIGKAENSVFTRYLIEGLWTGEADGDGDGWISLDDLYDYIYEKIVSQMPMQTPGKWSYKQQGKIIIARNPYLMQKQERLESEEAGAEQLAAQKKAEEERKAREKSIEEKLSQTISPMILAEEDARQKWLKRIDDGFEPIPFESPSADRPYGHALAPVGKVILGKDEIPFSLPPYPDRNGHGIIEVHPSHAKDQVARDIRPAEVKNVVALYVLLSAGDTRRIRGEQRFEEKEIGRLQIHFSDGKDVQDVPLRLGIEIREWVSGDMTWEVVTKASAAEEVWHSPDRRCTIDMIRVDIKGSPRDVSELIVIGECRWLTQSYRDALPSVRISGVTYKSVEPAEVERKAPAEAIRLQDEVTEQVEQQRLVREKPEAERLQKMESERLVAERAESERTTRLGQPPVSVVKRTPLSERLAQYFSFKVRFEQGESIIYRKHWYILLQTIWLPSEFILLVTGLIGIKLSGLLPETIPLSVVVLVAFLLLIPFAGWWLYKFQGWKNDIYQITPEQIVAINKKPLGQEVRKSALLDNILSLRYERPGLLGMLLNYGYVMAEIGDAEFLFEGVYDPAGVQNDIYYRIEACKARKPQAEAAKKRDETAD